MVPAGRIGLDAERIEVRSPSFASSWLSPGERSLSSADPARETAIWTVKEAVLKALGQGMALPSGEVEVVELCGRRARVQLHGAALALHRAQGGGPVGASLSWEAGCVVATCLLRGAIAERVRTAA
jgi:phosphopantetheine--protein transferase-like protein